jgi:cobalt-zinc-cadmium resistance protein CzcA
MKGIVRRSIILQRRKPILFYFLLFCMIGWGLSIALQSEIQAFPELTNVQVQVITQFPGKAAEEVERQLTVPVEVATNGLPGLINQRSISIFGLSVVTLTFDDNVVSRDARIAVSQRLNDVDLPEGVKPGLSPDTTPVGEIFRYTLQGTLPIDEMRLIEDWRMERELKSIPGVADVVSFGGPVRTIEVRLDVPRIKALGLSVDAIAQALGQNHANAGGSMITHGDENYIVRSIGMYENPESLEQAVIATQHNVPIRVRDIGSIQLSNRPRLGQVGHNDNNDVVEGIVYLRQGADTLETCRLIREKIDKLNSSVLPKGVKIVPYYDRTSLIERSSHTVFHNIVFGIFLVCAVLTLGLGVQYWAMSLGVALIIPFALLMAFVGVRLMGYAPNLISLGAVDFGIIVETAVFAAEAVIVATARKRSKSPKVVTEAIIEVLGPAFFCASLLLIAFVPILSLQRVEGRIFKPLGITLISALIGGQLGALIFIPMFSFMVPTNPKPVEKLENFFTKVYEKCRAVSEWLLKLKHPKLVCGVVLGVLLFLFNWGLGREFLPQLNEGALYIRATAPSSISREAAVELSSEIRERLMTIPEVTDVVSQLGRPDDGTDVNGFDNIELPVILKPPTEWKSAKSIEGFTVLAQKALEGIDGVDFNFSQPIKDNVDEAISGVKGELVVKIFGPKLEDLQKYATEITDVLKDVPGAQDIAPEQLFGQPELRFQINRELLARYGLRVTDAEEILETALMGKFAAKMIDDQGRQIDILVKPSLADNIDRSVLASLPVITPEGAKIPLDEVSQPKLVEGVGRIYRELGERRVAVKCSVRGRAVVDFVKDASARIAKLIHLPDKYRMVWSGSFENAARAGQQLMIIVPICLIAMIVLLMTWFDNWKFVGLILWEIPFSLLGGLAGLRLTGLNLSISAAAGGIVLVGVSFLTGMMLIAEWRHLKDPWAALKEKCRSILVSSGVAIIGLVPAAFSHGIGSETARPFAVMILGGLITSLVLTLTALPAFMASIQSTKRNS